MSLPARIRPLIPGLALSVAVTAAAALAQMIEARLLGRAWLEALVLAILIGAAVRTAWRPGPRFLPGIAFGARTVLEVAVMLLGASIGVRTLLHVGPWLLGGIALVVLAAIAASYAIGRLLGLKPRMALLVACGNSICGNSAIAAVAPVIGADSDDVVASIAFTAVLGVAVVLGLPLLIPLLRLSGSQYGVLAGLTVYAVPQVLAATIPVGALAAKLGTLVKLVRVLMLGPVVLGLSLLAARRGQRQCGSGGAGFSLGRLVPWFIIGFLALMGVRSMGLVPHAALAPLGAVTGWLTVVSMAALGLGVDVRMVARAGARVTLAVCASLLLLGGISLGLIHVVGVL
ncbi:MAG: putative sulfate exporter family transporter [Rhodospirillales bacterium]|nr:putative sulfate exporter family transporter [Rhodospirillales bacterium]